MSKELNKGLFISLEGGEGSGKTTQINRLAESLTNEGYKVITTREPGGTPEGESIRHLLVQRDGGNWNAMAEILLLFAARVMHVEKIIKPAIATGKIIICDRFTDSTFAYQGYGRGFDIDLIKDIQKSTIGDLTPDITLILDIDAKQGLERSTKRLSGIGGFEQTEDRFERLDIDFHERLRQGFLDIAKAEPGRCHVVDALQDPAIVFDTIQNIVLQQVLKAE